jgi:8-oxo-dGTP diphosphatase
MAASNLVRIAIAIVEQGDRVLIGRRPEGGPLAGFWEFPGGKVRPDESGEAAAVRECREETGLDIRVNRLYWEGGHLYEHGRLHLQFFAAVPLAPTSQAVEPFRWVLRSELPRYRFPPANEIVIAMLTNPDQERAGRQAAEIGLLDREIPD